MARLPTLTPAELESQLGPRGNLKVNSENRALVRKWLVSAQGFRAEQCVGLSIIELAMAYNKLDGSGIASIRSKLAKAAEEDGLGDLPLVENNEPAAAAAVPDAYQHDPNPKVAPMLNPANKDAAQLLRDLLLEGYQPTVSLDETKVRAIVEEAIKGVAPRVIEIYHDDKPPVKVEGLVHAEFEFCLNYILKGGSLMLVGPAGSGKTYLAIQLAKALDRKYTVIAGSGGVDELHLYGKILPRNDWAFVPSELVQLYEEGNSAIIIDEVTGIDPNVSMSLNMGMANGSMYITAKDGNPRVQRGDNVSFICTDNTFGTGADPLFCGRNPMDEALRDRVLFVTVDYDKRLEESIAAAGGLTAAEMASLWELRDKVRENQIRRSVSMRAFEKAIMLKACGKSWREIMAYLTNGWSKDEKAKVGM